MLKTQPHHPGRDRRQVVRIPPQRWRLLLGSLLALGAVGIGGITARAAELPYLETFDLADGSAWPSPWFAGSQHVTVSDIQNGRARLNGDPAFVARMILPEHAEVEVEAQVTFEFEDVANQGIGFYVRQNGGTLQEYLPHGQGYAMFLKGAWLWPEDLGLWREINGVETQFATGYEPIAGGLQNGIRYRLRFRVTQADASTTLLQAKVWPEADTEPSGWTLEAFDNRPELQGTAGSFAADIYNFSGFSHIFLDDLLIVNAQDPAEVGEEFPNGALDLSVSPNPLFDRAALAFTLPEAGRAHLQLVDVQGRTVAVPFSGHLAAGASSLSWRPQGTDTRPLPAGVYFLQLNAGGRQVSRRVVVAGP